MEIPLFPLPNLVLFPNVVLPLHIFEDRYKQMINSCIDSVEAFGLIQLREGAQEETEQTIHRVGTTARIVEVERLDGGRMNILCHGVSRFRVLRFIESEPFWKGKVEIFEVDPGDDECLGPLADEVAALYRKAFDLGVQLNAVSAADLQLPGAPIELSFMVSYVLDIPPEQKQKLLELKSTEKRLRELVTHVDDAVRKLEQQIVYRRLQQKVRGNGDLGKPGSTGH